MPLEACTDKEEFSDMGTFTTEPAGDLPVLQQRSFTFLDLQLLKHSLAIIIIHVVKLKQHKTRTTLRVLFLLAFFVCFLQGGGRGSVRL